MNDRQVKSCSFEVNTAADKAVLGFPRGALIQQVNVIVGGTDAGGAVIELDSLVAGTRGSADVAQINIPAANTSGKTLVKTIADFKEIAAGGCVVVQVASESVTSLLVDVEVVYWDLGANKLNETGVSETA